MDKLRPKIWLKESFLDLKISRNSSFSYSCLFFNFDQLLLKITYIKWGKYDKYISLEYFYEKKIKKYFSEFFLAIFKKCQKNDPSGGSNDIRMGIFYLFLCFLVKSNNYSPVLT